MKKKNYFITGCSSGVGRILAKELVLRGHAVWGMARRHELLQKLSNEISSDLFTFSAGDVGLDKDNQRVYQLMGDKKFFPDVVVLNAGINTEVYPAAFKIEEFEKVVSVNVFGTMKWIGLFLPGFIQKKNGHFVTISSLAALRGDARWPAYTSSKGAIARAFEAFRGRYHKEGIIFSTIHLGAVNTGMGAGARSIFRLGEAGLAGKIISVIENKTSEATVPFYLKWIFNATRILPDSLFSDMIVSSFVKKKGK